MHRQRQVVRIDILLGAKFADAVLVGLLFPIFDDQSGDALELGAISRILAIEFQHLERQHLERQRLEPRQALRGALLSTE
jgi:hypothetical protein